MCIAENEQMFQRGMYFAQWRLLRNLDVPAHECSIPRKIRADGLTIEYEGHDRPRRRDHNPKDEDQPGKLTSGALTQNGLFANAVENYKTGGSSPELVKVYEKILRGIWSLKGFFNLIDYDIVHDGRRKVYRFVLQLSDKEALPSDQSEQSPEHTRLIPSEVKKEVWKRDHGKCVICGDTKNLHFDHDLPFGRGGTSLTGKNVRLLCMSHNLAKSMKIE